MTDARELPARPPVDVVVPFVGSDADLARVAARLSSLRTQEDDLLVVADNRPSADRELTVDHVRVVPAPGQPSSYYARNRGAEHGANPWIVFLDADVEPEPALLDEYFASPPPDDVAILIGGIVDAPPQGRTPTAVERYSQMRGAVGHETTLRDDGFSFAQTANVAIRRSAFEAVGGFTEGIRSGGDADMTFRVLETGARMEPRISAQVEHENRSSLRAFVRQYARYGSGAAWLDARYPGFAPRPTAARLAVAFAASAARSVLAVARRRPADAQVFVLDSVQRIAMLVGRGRSNEVDSRQ